MAAEQDIIERAKRFATAAHASIDQRRKYTNEPYIVHPQAVAAVVASVTRDKNMIAAAWLHDVVEDTPVTIEQIREQFGSDVTSLVDGMTDKATLSDGNRKQRLAMDRDRLAKTDARVKTIKLADLVDNLTGIVDQSSGFAVKYLQEREALLEVIRDGNQELAQTVREIIAVERAKLEKLG